MTHAESRTISYGIAASVALHLLLFIGMAFWTGKASDLRKLVMPLPPEEEPEVTLLFPQAIEVVPALPADPEPVPSPTGQKPVEKYIRTTQNTESETAPEKADFVSDRDTIASAKLPPAAGGVEPLPSMNGLNFPTAELANRDFKDGETKDDSAPSTPPQLPAMPEQMASEPPQPEPVPAVTQVPPSLEPKLRAPDPPTPAPSPKTEMAKKEDSAAEIKMKELDAVLDSKPVEHLPLEVRSPSEMSAADMLPPAEPEPAVPPALPVPEMSVPKAQPVEEVLANAPDPKKDAFQPHTRTSEVKGTISNIGSEDAVNAMATPTGRYMRRVTSVIEQKWHQLRNEKKDFVEPGKLRLKFYVNKDGHTEDISIIFNEANAVLTDFTLTAILKAELPPIPKDLLPILEKERVEIEYDVVIY